MAGYGFIPAYHLMGGVIRPQEMKITTGYNVNIFSGDVITAVDAGTIEAGVVATQSDLIGVFGGVSYVDAGGSQIYSRYWPASTTATAIKAFVYSDPFIVYRAQSDQDTNALLQTTVWSNGDFLATAGSTVTGQSGHVIDSSVFITNDASPAVGNFQLLGSAQVDGAFTAAGTVMDVYVKFAEHAWLHGSTAGSVAL